MGKRSESRPPAMKDVAALAGVSHQTVSRVLNGTGKVAPDTRERILTAITELGYRRNSAARALVTRKTGIIGIVTTTSVHYGPTSILVAIELAARQAGYFTGVTALEDFSVESLSSAFDHFLGLSVEAIVVIAPVVGIAQAVEAVHVPVPVVAVTAADVEGASGLRSVRADQLGGAREAVRHLISLGHRDIAHVPGPQDWFEARMRMEGWRLELEAIGARMREPVAYGWEPEVGYRAGLELVRQGVPTAVFAANDAIALGLIRAFAESGLSVPRDVSVVGFDDEPASEYFLPGLTTVRQDFADLGHQVLRLVREAIAGEGNADPLLRPTRLIVRDSTAAPRV